ncbi:hypothetical protein DFH28DRAFT_1140406 [Melampsora americana]|nr:hypothetical protein DFH28DRAFT_1140406 [Melampsora americana]
MHKSGLLWADGLPQQTLERASELDHKTKMANKHCLVGPADAQVGNSTTDEDSIEIMNYKISSCHGLGHPHQPKSVDLAGNPTDCTHKMVANHLIRIEDEPFASTFWGLSSSSEVAGGFGSHRSAREISRFKSPPSISGSKSSSFPAQKSCSKDLASEVTYELQSHVSQSSAPHSAMKQNQSRYLSPDQDLERSNVSNKEIDQLYDSSPQLQITRALPGSPLLSIQKVPIPQIDLMFEVNVPLETQLKEYDNEEKQGTPWKKDPSSKGEVEMDLSRARQ